jgi:hypothetical protein
MTDNMMTIKLTKDFTVSVPEVMLAAIPQERQDFLASLKDEWVVTPDELKLVDIGWLYKNRKVAGFLMTKNQAYFFFAD